MGWRSIEKEKKPQCFSELQAGDFVGSELFIPEILWGLSCHHFVYPHGDSGFCPEALNECIIT